MKIQSASIDVPGGCPNKCKFCVSESNTNNLKRMTENVVNDLTDPWVVQQYSDRLEYLRDKNVDTIIFTGSRSEPMNNLKFIEKVGEINNILPSRFKNLEVQTSGINVNYENLLRLDNAGIKTISLSLSSFNSGLNSEISGINSKYIFDIKTVCSTIKDFGLNLRLSLNMNKIGFDVDTKSKLEIEKMFEYASYFLNADQITFRKLYECHGTKQGEWVSENKWDDSMLLSLENFVKENGRKINKLAFGAMKYDIYNMSTVVDMDCMSEEPNENLKYAILMRNCKLYSNWQSPASLIF